MRMKYAFYIKTVGNNFETIEDIEHFEIKEEAIKKVKSIYTQKSNSFLVSEHEDKIDELGYGRITYYDMVDFNEKYLEIGWVEYIDEQKL